jgi:arabinan endo-1,5-alpha-L-arabinosidase
MNGNRWVGTGHNTVFRDFGGQWWTIYHAVDRFHPYFESEPGFTKRPPLLDPLDWVHGWPSVRSGRWASNRSMPAPAAQPGQHSRYRPHLVRPDRRGSLRAHFSDEFSGTGLSDRWTWVREPAAGTYGVEAGTFRFDTQKADLNTNDNTASVLTEPAPRGDYVLQTKVRLNLPVQGDTFNFVQAGMVVYGSDDAFVKLVHFSNFETRQTEFAKEVPTAPAGFPRYGNTVVGPPGEVTWLRIVKRTTGAGQTFTAYTSQDGRHWVRGGTWVHNRLGQQVRIGLVSMGGTGFNARFDYVRVWRLRH